MKAAEKLRMDIKNKCPFTKDEFINQISERIKLIGRASYICDKHIRETSITGCSNTIRMVDEQVAIDYAKSEGFNFHYDYNSYGVRYIIFVL